MAYIEFKNVTKSYGKQIVLEKFNLNIEKGQFVTLLGASGCGKSTLLRCLAGLEGIDSGEIFLDGINITKYKSQNRNIGMIFQQYSLFPTMNVYNNIAFGLKMNKTDKNTIDKNVKEVLSLVNLNGFEKKYPSQLSGGEQQRVAIARSIIMKPKVMLFDEPFSAIDAKLRRELQIKIKEIHRKLNITSIFVTHDQDEAMVMSDVIHLMNKGEISQSGSPSDIYLKPQNEYVASFIGEYNIFEWEGKKYAARPEIVELDKTKKEKENYISGHATIVDIIYQKGLIRYLIKIYNKDIILKSDYIMNDKFNFIIGEEIFFKISKSNVLEL